MGYGLESKVKEEMYELCERLFPSAVVLPVME